MTFIPLPAFEDNYIWIIEDKDSSDIWAVDPGSARVVLDYCQTKQKNLLGILITHHHKDHTGGVKALHKETQCKVYGPSHLKDLVTHSVVEGEVIPIFDSFYQVLETPGHTLDHLCYFSSQNEPILFSGDTLFKGGCGRIMEGTPEQMLSSMQKISNLPDNTIIYCTHEYTLANYRFALSLDPNNTDLKHSHEQSKLRRNQNLPTLPTTLQLEKKTNPFLRSDILEIKKQAAQQLNEEISTNPISSFSQIRRAKDCFS